MKDARFFERKCFLIGFKEFEKVIQEITEDNTIKIESDYPVLSCYSRANDYAYEEEELKELVEEHLQIDITSICKFTDLEEIYFITN